jgi:hypothetical protein
MLAFNQVCLIFSLSKIFIVLMSDWFYFSFNKPSLISNILTLSYCVFFQNFEDYDFGEQTVDGIHLSLRFSKSASGYYQATAHISFT